jgi:hypothetical protein
MDTLAKAMHESEVADVSERKLRLRALELAVRVAPRNPDDVTRLANTIEADTKLMVSWWIGDRSCNRGGLSSAWTRGRQPGRPLGRAPVRVKSESCWII